MSKAGVLAIIGVISGVVTGEYFPNVFASGLDLLGAHMSVPFSPYRNELAVKYALIFGVIGFAIGLLMHLATKKGTANS